MLCETLSIVSPKPFPLFSLSVASLVFTWQLVFTYCFTETRMLLPVHLPCVHKSKTSFFTALPWVPPPFSPFCSCTWPKCDLRTCTKSAQSSALTTWANSDTGLWPVLPHPFAQNSDLSLLPPLTWVHSGRPSQMLACFHLLWDRVLERAAQGSAQTLLFFHLFS